MPWRDFPLARAVAASAAFPVGLPPLALRLRDFPVKTTFSGPLARARTIYLTDGGVLGTRIQTLLKGRCYASWNLIVSDVGVNIPPWHGSGPRGSLKGLLIWLLCERTLDRLMLVMNDKLNRLARKEAYDELVLSWVADAVKRGGVGEAEADAVVNCLGRIHRRGRRTLLMARVGQDWTSFFTSIPEWRLLDLSRNNLISPTRMSSHSSAEATVQHLERSGCEFGAARDWYRQTGGESGVGEIRKVKTNFAALPRDTVIRLAAHAAWQIHAAHSIYADHVSTYVKDRSTSLERRR